MKSQPTFGIKGAFQFLTVIFLFLLLSLFAAGNAQAGKPAPDPGPVGVDNLASWSSDLDATGIMEASPRLCKLSQMSLDETSGTYSCALNDENILYDFTNMDAIPIHRRGDDWRCTSGSFWAYTEPDVEYSFSWNGDCTQGCPITIVNAFSRAVTIGGSVTRFTIQGFAVATTGTEFNPFTTAKSLTVDYLHLTLFGGGSGAKVLAVCKLTPRAGSEVAFVTTPVPVD
jgi:hypothetical protein